MAGGPKESSVRDDAEEQPESGYPAGRAPSKPSAGSSAEDSGKDAQSGSESEFDSTKRRPESNSGQPS